MSWEESEEYEALSKLYGEVLEDGFFIKEYQGIAAVGDIRDLDTLCEEAGKTGDEVIDMLGLGEVVDLAAPGKGESREEAIRDGWNQAREYREAGYWPRLAKAREKAGMEVGETKQMGTF